MDFTILAFCHPYCLEGKCNMHLSEIWHSKKNDCRLSRTQVYRKSYGFSSKHQSVFLSKTTQIPIKFHRHVIMDKLFCISITSVFILLKFLLLFLQETCPLGASSVPHLSKQRSPIGQASCPFLCLFDLFFRKARCLIIMANPQVGRQPFRYADYDTCNFPKCDVLLRQG